MTLSLKIIQYGKETELEDLTENGLIDIRYKAEELIKEIDKRLNNEQEN